MRKGEAGELYFTKLPRYVGEVMIPSCAAKTQVETMQYIEDHFDEKFQVILKMEYNKDRKILLTK